MLTYVWLDQFFAPGAIFADAVKRPFITVGMLAFLLMVPLAVTSTDAMIRRLGKRWTRLHQAVYLIAILGIVHYALLVKADLSGPIRWGIVVGVLLAYRLIKLVVPGKARRTPAKA